MQEGREDGTGEGAKAHGMGPDSLLFRQKCTAESSPADAVAPGHSLCHL